MKEEYLNVLKSNKVSYFYHFTNIVNLKSILANGILSVQEMRKRNISFSCTDKDRNDNQLNCISLSLTTTNKSMLYAKKNNISSEWVVFEINAVPIISKFYNKIYYCKYNASSPSTIKILSDNGNYLRTINAFRNMFDENSQINSQAEILLNGFVDMCDVNRIYVESIQSKLLVEQLLIEYKIDSINVVIKKELF